MNTRPLVRKAGMASMVTIDCGSCVNDRWRRGDNGPHRTVRCLHAATMRGDHFRTCAPLLSRVTTRAAAHLPAAHFLAVLCVVTRVGHAVHRELSLRSLVPFAAAVPLPDLSGSRYRVPRQA
jgi:hypothetical protein